MADIKPASFLEKVIGALALRALNWLSIKARQRGDMHEHRHASLAFVAGVSDHDLIDQECLLPVFQAALVRHEAKKSPQNIFDLIKKHTQKEETADD